MTYGDLISNIDIAYEAICERINKCKDENVAHGIVLERITFEDVDLEDLLEPILLPLLPELIDKYSILPIEKRLKSYRVYIASLCELVKNGLINGGILKTMDARLGEVFDRNHHYDLLQRALQYEGIPIIQKHRKYEETIINEAGIPRGYHRKCLEIFSIYWKWTKNLDYNERSRFVTYFFNGKPIDKVLIVDSNDKDRLSHLRSETASFSEKIIKTCLKLDRVFSAIDAYPGSITEDNLRDVADEISTNIGFNVFSVLRSDDIYEYILDYAKKVSFLKFSRILENLPSNEEIILPNGKRRKIAAYSFDNYMGGCHVVRGNTYEVSYPVSLDIESIFLLPKYQITMFGNAAIYTSDEPIFAEIDGVQKTGRTFINQNKELLFVFYERIGPATFAYIDDQPVNISQPFSRRTYLGKYWDSVLQKHRIGFFLSEIKYASSSKSMKPIRVLCNDREIFHGATNSHGSFRISEKVIELSQEELASPLNIKFFADNELVDTWTHTPEVCYLWATQTGLRVKNEIRVSEWVGPPNAILFTKVPEDKSDALDYLYEIQGYYVYSVKIDFTKFKLSLNCITIPIVHSNTPYLKLNSSFEVHSQQICISEDDPISVVVESACSEDNNTILQVEYEDEHVSYNIKNLGVDDFKDIRKLIDRKATQSTSGYAGNWQISLFHDDKKVNCIGIVVLPNIRMEFEYPIYAEGLPARVKAIANYPCFESEGEFVQSKSIALDSVHLSLDGNYVFVKPIDVSIYIDRCGLAKEYQITPRVWGIRKKSETTKLWDVEPIKVLSVNELMDTSVYVCSTGNTCIRIKTKDDSMNRFIVPGFNRINCKRLFDSWNFKNQIELTDEFGITKNLSIECNPRFEYLGKEQTENELVYFVLYDGPISTSLNFRAYSGRQIVSQIMRNVYQNKFVIKIRLGIHLISDKQITIEAKVGDQDYQTVFIENVLLTKPAALNTKPRLRIERTTRLIELLEYHCSKKVSSKNCDNNQLIALLEQGGKP